MISACYPRMKAGVAAILFYALSICCTFRPVQGHSTLDDPPPRGSLSGHDFARDVPAVDLSAPNDWRLHFPAGEKNAPPGGGLRSPGLLSQEKEARWKWTLFEPLRPGFRWRSGVCGDLKGSIEAHRRGGEFYHGGMISRTYKAGSTIDFKVSIVGHHNGFYVFHICDVSRCGGEISEECFRSRHCRLLRRAYVRKCKISRRCGPIDSKYKGRWYIPCPIRANFGGTDHYGRDGTMRYKLPDGFACEHCVIHWSYTSGNKCNAPGVVDYFDSSSRPKAWARCEGQSDAVGGVNRNLRECGGRLFAEDYFNCADVRIVWPSAPEKNPIKDLHIGEIKGGSFHVQRLISGYTTFPVGIFKSITIRARMRWAVAKVEIFVDDGSRKLVREMTSAPYYIGGNDIWGRPHSWRPITDRPFKVIVRAGGFEKAVTVLFKTG